MNSPSSPSPVAPTALHSSRSISTVRAFLASVRAPSSPDALSSWGWSTAEGLSDATDTLIRPVISSLDGNKVSVYAVGGYGRCELMPFSDVDLLIITRKEVDLAPIHAQLWNLGIKPSILLRSSRDLKSSAKDDLKFATTLLDHRLLHGDPEPLLGDDMRWVGNIRKNFPKEQSEAAAERHAQHRGAGCQEPNIREGLGGLRDLQARRWLATASGSPRAAGRRNSPSRWGGSLDAAALEDYGILLAARFIIHHVSGRREDRMLLVDRDPIIEWLGWPEPDTIFRVTCLAMKRTAIGRPAPAVGTVSAPTPLAPRAFLDLLQKCVTAPAAGAVPTAGAEPRRSFLALLRAWDASGELGTLIPDWSRIEGLVRNDPVHWYTPDEHTLLVIGAVETILEKGHRSLDLTQITRPDLLILAALFHDLGKGTGRDHSEVGASLASDTMKSWGMTDDDADKVAFLVRHHQLLTHNAFMRDIDDYNLIHEIAKRIENSTENLALLYALTVADLRSVSGDLFTDWKAELLATLTTRLRRQCSYYLPPQRIGREGLRRRREQVRRLLGAEYELSIERHFSRIDARYALAHSPEQIGHHIRLLPRLRNETVVLERHAVPERAFTEITILTKSHHGLFAEIAGTLSARGLNILAADISTRTDDLAIDSFKVSENRDASLLDAERWRALERDLRRVISGEIAINDYIAARKPYVARRSGSGPPRPSTVQFDNDSSPTHTIVEVTAPDEIGLLYRIAAVFRDCGIGITSAIVTTEGDLAIDIFYVTMAPAVGTASGSKITDRDTMERIRQGITDYNERHAGLVTPPGVGTTRAKDSSGS